MKQIVLTLLLFVAFTTSYAQGPYHERQNAHYVEAAAKEFDLDKKQQKELSEIRMEMVTTYITSNKSYKGGDISEEEKKELTKAASQTFHKKLSDLTGKPFKEMQPWLAKMRDELKTVK